jgi:hypothetical protein
MPNLRHLELFRNKHLVPVNFGVRRDQSNRAPALLSKLRALEYLALDSCYINNDVLAEISAPRLKKFVLWYPTGKGLVSQKLCFTRIFYD